MYVTPRVYTVPGPISTRPSNIRVYVRIFIYTDEQWKIKELRIMYT